MSISCPNFSQDVAESNEGVEELRYQTQGLLVRRSAERPSRNELDLVIERLGETIVEAFSRRVGRQLYLFHEDATEPSRKSQNLPPRTALQTLEAVERLLNRLQI